MKQYFGDIVDTDSEKYAQSEYALLVINRRAAVYQRSKLGNYEKIPVPDNYVFTDYSRNLTGVINDSNVILVPIYNRGHRGPMGPIGTPGILGRPGVPSEISGSPGILGATGLPGLDGSPGSIGISGAPGLTGVQGISSLPGPQGISGSPGAPGKLGPFTPDYIGVDLISDNYKINQYTNSIPTDSSQTAVFNSEEPNNGLTLNGGNTIILPSTGTYLAQYGLYNTFGQALEPIQGGFNAALIQNGNQIVPGSNINIGTSNGINNTLFYSTVLLSGIIGDTIQLICPLKSEIIGQNGVEPIVKNGGQGTITAGNNLTIPPIVKLFPGQFLVVMAYSYTTELSSHIVPPLISDDINNVYSLLYTQDVFGPSNSEINTFGTQIAIYGTNGQSTPPNTITIYTTNSTSTYTVTVETVQNIAPLSDLQFSGVNGLGLGLGTGDPTVISSLVTMDSGFKYNLYSVAVQGFGSNPPDTQASYTPIGLNFTNSNFISGSIPINMANGITSSLAFQSISGYYGFQSNVAGSWGLVNILSKVGDLATIAHLDIRLINSSGIYASSLNTGTVTNTKPLSINKPNLTVNPFYLALATTYNITYNITGTGTYSDPIISDDQGNVYSLVYTLTVPDITVPTTTMVPSTTTNGANIQIYQCLNPGSLPNTISISTNDSAIEYFIVAQVIQPNNLTSTNISSYTGTANQIFGSNRFTPGDNYNLYSMAIQLTDSAMVGSYTSTSLQNLQNKFYGSFNTVAGTKMLFPATSLTDNYGFDSSISGQWGLVNMNFQV